MRLTFALPAFLLLSALPLSARADAVTDWNKNTIDEIRKLGLGPNPATRTLAIAHIAAYEAVNAVTKTHEPYHAALTPTLPVSQPAAVASAVYWALVLQFPNEKPTLDTLFSQSLAEIPEGAAKQHGLDLGKAAAVDIFTLRIGDGASATASYPGSTDPGKWRPTPRADLSTPLAAAEPWWRNVKPFALTSPDQLRPAAPPAIASPEFATAYLETKSLGKSDSAARAAEQTQIANFWKQPTHVPFNAIARSVSKAKELSLADNARLFALLNITLADTRIAVWDAKYQYGYWRPITAINTDADYGNAAAVPDTTWVPLLETPNHPEYPSGHSTTGGGGGHLLATFFGTDEVSFAVGSDTLAGVTRGFEKFSAAEQENADSRIYGGIHYRFSNDTGIALGHQIADIVAQNYLRPLDPSPTGEGGAGGEGAVAGGGSGGTSTGDNGGNGEIAGPDREGGAAGEAGAAPTTGGKGGSGGAGSGGGAGSTAKPNPPPNDEVLDACSVAQPGRASSAFGLVLLLGAAGVAWRRRRRQRP
ncbi:MAG TPA: vanadium-dependent haloperoxidase [Polyangiaceae bacterium]|nr:vanadium-dependent haloperoxidase [Polyangiaceae bacterium]